jgi:hypothetical protein
MAQYAFLHDWHTVDLHLFVWYQLLGFVAFSMDLQFLSSMWKELPLLHLAVASVQ